MSVFFGTAGLAVLAAVLAGDCWLLWLAGEAETARHWARYVSEWTAWNHVRTAAALGAAISFILASGNNP